MLHQGDDLPSQGPSVHSLPPEPHAQLREERPGCPKVCRARRPPVLAPQPASCSSGSRCLAPPALPRYPLREARVSVSFTAVLLEPKWGLACGNAPRLRNEHGTWPGRAAGDACAPEGFDLGQLPATGNPVCPQPVLDSQEAILRMKHTVGTAQGQGHRDCPRTDVALQSSA